MKTPKLRNCKAMNCLNCGLFDHQTGSSTTINARLLPSTIAHKTIVISFKRTFKFNFVFENLQILALTKWNTNFHILILIRESNSYLMANFQLEYSGRRGMKVK